MTILVTGGCGFIGSNFIRYCLKNYDEQVVNLDCLTYAGRLENLVDYEDDSRYTFVKGNICDRQTVQELLKKYKPWAIVNFAAESHVDRSIKDSAAFLYTNVLGTVNLLDVVKEQDYPIRFHHISTDEVYGSLGLYDAPFKETTPYDPRSPYSASKASSDHFVQAYHETHGLDTVITNCSNNYGPYQYPEKLIPTIITRAMIYKKVPVYGNGMNIRDWLYVDDHCSAIDTVLRRGVAGQKYNVGGDSPLANIEVVTTILEKMRLNIPKYIEYVEDRKGHDFRYEVDSSKMREEFGWRPLTSFEEGIDRTIHWYRNNLNWLRDINNVQ
jgi:dTDP-glucose 4,6-dehydratase